MGLLADIFSTADTAKRRLSGLLADPLGTLALGVTRFGEDQGGLLNMTQNAYPMAGNKTVLNSPQQIANFRQQVADKGAEMAMQAATVWHGSPHKFDKFDSSKIGTGEGAQAYGHGLYLAESPDVATRYKPSIPRPHVDGVDAATLGQPLWEVSDTMASRGFGVDEYKQFQKTYRGSQIESALKAGNARKAEILKESLDEELKIADGLRGKNISRDTGFLYKVDLPDEHIAKMLDWDKPLSQQPHIREMVPPELEKVFSTSKDMPWTLGKKADAMTGEDLVRSMAALKGTYAGASDVIKNAGIPGIRYLDGGSRGTGAGTSNFVIFPQNEGLLKILERNGAGI